MSKDKEVFIQLIVDRLAPDRNQYKPYGISLIPHKTLVSVPVSAKEVTVVYQKNEEGEDTKTIDFVILSLDGLVEMTGRIADSIDTLHNKHLSDLQKGLK